MQRMKLIPIRIAVGQNWSNRGMTYFSLLETGTVYLPVWIFDLANCVTGLVQQRWRVNQAGLSKSKRSSGFRYLLIAG